MRAADAKRASDAADAAVKSRVDAGVIKGDGAARKAHALYLSDRATFESFFPLPEKKDEAPPTTAAERALLSGRVATQETPAGAFDRGEPAARTHSDLAAERAVQLREKRPTLSSEDALIEASRQIAREETDAAVRAIADSYHGRAR